MKLRGRREFLGSTLTGGAGLLALRSAKAADGRIEVLIDEPVGTISPDIYSHFIEHLGGVVYDGIWVGENSRIPNIGGIRRALVENLRRIKPGLIRYPGGCFADSYNWRDGIGPRGERPRRTNYWMEDPLMRQAPEGATRYESNQFGTNEFMRLCHSTKAEPYLAANLRSLPAEDFYSWVEYCNAAAGKTTLADKRAASGARDPFKVRYWGVGNESWGCGGHFTADEYAVEFRRYATWVPSYGLDLKLIASGPDGSGVDPSASLEWTRRFFNKLVEKGQGQLGRLHGWSLHYYTWNVTGELNADWVKGKGDALDFPVEEWYEVLRQADRIDGLINSHWSVMGEVDRRHQVKLFVDEWGTWYRPGTEVAPTHIYSQISTLRDALVAALTLDTFNRHADKVVMSCPAQVVNCLQSLFLAHEDKFVVTSNFHVFEMYAAHQGGKAVRTIFSVPPLRYDLHGKTASLWNISGSASLHGKDLVLTVVNPHATEPRECELSIRGANILSGQARVLTSTDIHAHSSFANPQGLEPRDAEMHPGGSPLVYRFSPASVTRLQLRLA